MADTFKKTDMLVYTGGATVREVTEQQWKDAGVENQGTVQWAKPEYSVKVGDLTTDAVRLLLDRHDDFEIRSGGDAPAPNGN